MDAGNIIKKRKGRLRKKWLKQIKELRVKKKLGRWQKTVEELSAKKIQYMKKIKENEKIYIFDK